MNFRTVLEEYLSLIGAVCACQTVCSAAPYVCSTEVSLCCINSESLGLEQTCDSGSYAPTHPRKWPSNYSYISGTLPGQEKGVHGCPAQLLKVPS